jgi:hypothetical protein
MPNLKPTARREATHWFTKLVLNLALRAPWRRCSERRNMSERYI